MTWLLISAGIALGVSWWRIVALAAVVVVPLPIAVLLAFHTWRSRHGDAVRGARFCDAVATELRSGASLRLAVTAAARSVDAGDLSDWSASGAAMTTVSALARAEFPDIGDELGAVLSQPGGPGVSPALLFDEIGTLALAQAEVRREVSVASAPARVTAGLFTLAPVAVIAWLTARGELGRFLVHPAQRSAVLTGLVLTIGGIVVSAMIWRRAR